ncbi:MarR family winged helix-turn-helix transcriptional regulator [Dactylosporangium darangshiense]|jgi:DNA-binding MarR family transcriptional regulator|uniref:MarR family transcriptional regulator n=1 Tax=Dactylosporangium darangshiense TaxID=579108 RepID=A0ABP8CWR0_9ACTN
MTTPGSLVWRLSMRWRVLVDRALAPLELTHAQYTLLANLYGRPERPSQRGLADRTGLEPLYVSKLARALEAAGLIEREPDPADTRAVRLALTERGRAVTGEAVGIVRGLQERLLAPIGGPGSPQTEAFVATLEKLLEGDPS